MDGMHELVKRGAHQVIVTLAADPASHVGISRQEAQQ